MSAETPSPVTGDASVLARTVAGTARITLNRPQRRNALSLELMLS